jgi:hypothetical protein
VAETQRSRSGTTRRALLGGALIAGGGLLLAASLVKQRPDRWASVFVTRSLRRGLGDLAVDPQDVDRFVAEFLASRPGSDRFLLGFVGIAAPLLPVIAWLPAARRELRRAEDRIVSRFLLGSDFFRKGSDRSRRVRYLGLWDPYQAPCANPFARFD